MTITTITSQLDTDTAQIREVFTDAGLVPGLADARGLPVVVLAPASGGVYAVAALASDPDNRATIGYYPDGNWQDERPSHEFEVNLDGLLAFAHALAVAPAPAPEPPVLSVTITADDVAAMAAEWGIPRDLALGSAMGWVGRFEEKVLDLCRNHVRNAVRARTL